MMAKKQKSKKEKENKKEKAKKNEFSTMTLEEAKRLPLDGKEKDGKFTSLSLKKGLVKDDGKDYVERRIFKNADTDVISHDLPLPLSLKQAEAMYGESGCLDDIWTARRIKTDATKAGKGQGDPIVAIVRRAQKGEKLNVSDKDLVAKWFASMSTKK